MQEAWVRACRNTPTASFEEVRLPDAPLALLVTAPGCADCAAFETERMDAAERRLAAEYRGVHALHLWPCDTDGSRACAQTSGVDDVPAIVVLPPLHDRTASVRVLDAKTFASQ